MRFVCPDITHSELFSDNFESVSLANPYAVFYGAPCDKRIIEASRILQRRFAQRRSEVERIWGHGRTRGDVEGNIFGPFRYTTVPVS